MTEQDDHDRRLREQHRRQTERDAARAAAEYGIKTQQKKVSERKHNPQFYDRFTRTSLEDSEKFSHLVNEEAPWLADDHVLANRRQIYRQQRELLNTVRAEQSIVGANPGARLREKPLLNALAQGVPVALDRTVPLTAAGQQTITIDDPDYVPPMDSEERTKYDDLARVATARQSMGVDRAGSEALTTATTETRNVSEDKTESDAIESVSGVFD
ncbi:MAG: hypothetical protein ABEI98_04775 [Halorhabdus sp.]